MSVPFGRASVLGGNLQIARRDLDFDTRLGTVALGAVWNSAEGRWRDAFELAWDGATFVDAAGTSHAAGGLADGAAIPGTIWVRLDARTLRTKGGLVHEFDASGTARGGALRERRVPAPRVPPRRGRGRRRASSSCASSPRPARGTRLATFAYDGAGRLAAIEDRAGRRAELTWNAVGQLVAARSAFDVAAGLPGFRYGYASQGLVRIESCGRRARRVRLHRRRTPRTGARARRRRSDDDVRVRVARRHLPAPR